MPPRDVARPRVRLDPGGGRPSPRLLRPGVVPLDDAHGRRIFGLSRELAENTKALAANQGLYNAFLAAGLIWGALRPNALSVRVFFLACVVIAGIVGGFTAKRSILLVQALPGAIALVLVLLTQR